MAEIPYDDSPGVIAYRVRELARQLADLLKWKSGVDKAQATSDAQLGTLAEEMQAVRADVAGLRKMLLGLALSITGSAIVFSLSILAATGKLP